MKYVGYILLLLLAVLALLLLAAVVRAVRIKKPLPMTREQPSVLPRADEREAARYGEELGKMIKVPTVSSRGQEDLTQFRRLHEVMAEIFPLIHEKLEKIELEGNLLYRWPGTNPDLQPVLLMGHQDVVPASPEKWSCDPFGAEVKDGKLYGRGALDCKCTVYAEFAAVEELLRDGFQPEFDVYLACSINEEIAGDGAPMTVRYLKERGIRCAIVLDEGGAIIQSPLPGMKGQCAAIGVMEKGYVDVKFHATGKGGHSSTPPKGTPIDRLSKFVVRVNKKNPFRRQFSPQVTEMFQTLAPYLSFPMRLILGNLWLFRPLLKSVLPAVSPFGGALLGTTCAFTMSSGSKAANVIPQEATVTANLRVCAHQTAKESTALLEEIAGKYDIAGEIVDSRDASPAVDTKGDIYRTLAQCVADCFPDVAVTPYLIMGGTDCRHYTAITDNAIRFCPVRMDPQQFGSMHANDENITLSSLAECVKFYAYFLRQFQPPAAGQTRR